MSRRTLGIKQRGRFWARIIEKRSRRVVQDWYCVKNGPATVGLNYLLDAGFRGQTQISTWYIGLINESSFSAVAAGDTMSSHSGWVEWQGYTEANRLQWSPAAASSGALSNSTAVEFTNETGSTVQVRGMFLASNNTKGGTSGTLWATATESSARSILDDQTLQVIYETSLAAG